ncbi:hypothetical protein ACN27E_24605 [Mycobacterium sp. WMMD1722]|uniref:hypothetical protein n=1 Tax=Mycobacterium sp. WMMD1722 TaxID=3404117 RepID=UPI003BF57FBB
MRRTLGPFLVTGVVMAGAAAVVANPVVVPPSDVRVSVSDMATGGRPLDILDPVFLESIGAMRPGWPTAVATLDALLADLADNPTSVSPQVLAEALQRAADSPSPATGTSREQAHDAGTTAPPVLTDPTESTVVVMRALANLTSGINEAANTLVEQVTMTPALILALTERVISGELSPIEALRRLINAPFGGQAVITGDERIDAVFQNSVLTPILDALNASTKPPLETGAKDPAPGVARQAPAETSTSTSAAGERSSQDRADSNDARRTASAADAPQQPVLQSGGAPATPSPVPTQTPGVGSGGPTAPAFQSDMTEGVRDRIRQALDDIGDTVKRLTGQDDSGAGGGTTPTTVKAPKPAQPAGGDDSSGGGKDDAPTSGVGR